MLRLRICGVPLVVAGLTPALRNRFKQVMRPFLAVHDPVEQPIEVTARKRDHDDWLVVRDQRAMGAYNGRTEIIEQLEWHAINAALEANAAFAVIHGAALVRGSAVLLLLADSGAGKTTLTLGLMRRGWLPLSDDITLIERETLAVKPFARCFHVDDASRALALDEALVEWPGDLPGYARPREWGAGDLRPTTILVVERCVTCPARLRALSLAEAAAAIGAQGLRTSMSKAQLAQIAVRVAVGARHGGRLNNGELGETLDLIEAVSQD